MLILTTFLITSSQFRKAAVAQAQDRVAGDPPQVQLDRAMLQLLRDTNVRSSIAGHSLLGDLYGSNPGVDISERVRAVVSATPTQVGNAQIIRLSLQPTGGAIFSPLPNYYSGRVLTFITGSAKGASVRVLTYTPPASASAPAVLLVEAPTDMEHAGPVGGGIAVTSGVLINGAPFNGSGAGYNRATRNIDAVARFSKGAADIDAEVALLPHFITYATGHNVVDPANFGGDDESYDAVDYQNMFLAMVRHQPGPSGTFEDTTVTVPAPSFHRPALINYWMKDSDTATFWDASATATEQDLAFRRAAVLRPMPWDHPNFSGSNPAFIGSDTALFSALLIGPWDVDNDRDGVADSIWVDVGFPVQTNDNGQMYKPLVAILVKELDSRLNINAHSSLAQTTLYDSAPTARNTVLQPSSGDAMAGVASGGSFTLPRGNGYSPADIYLRGLFANNTDFNGVVRGRYDTSGAAPANPAARPGAVNTDDQLSRLNSTQLPSQYNQVSTPVISGYASPPYNYGVRSMALDWAGNPFYPSPIPPSQVVDDPHELDLMTARSRDTGQVTAGDTRDRPYSPTELERLLRWRDSDAPTLPDRIIRLAPTTYNNLLSSRARDLTTTESRYIPVPIGGWARGEFNSSPVAAPTPGNPVTPLDVFAYRLRKNGVPDNQINIQLQRMLPMELFRGQRFDINRLFGNGRDDNGNGVADEPLEVLRNVENLVYRDGGFNNGYGAFNAAGFDHTNNDPFTTVELNLPLTNPRQIYARQLYCLMMLLIDQGFQFPVTEMPLAATAPAELRARRVAQWAVNVVDARDPDAIMTAFEYDVNPLNGWADYVDGDLFPHPTVPPASQVERRVVWGAEAPDLLLTETKAFHNRQVRDTVWDDGDADKRGVGGNAMTPRDADLDQLRMPQGSLFLEFQCVRNKYSNNQALLPRELYNNGVLDLSKLAPANFTDSRGRDWHQDNLRHPVWQVSISKMYHDDVNEKNRFSALLRSATNPDTCSFDPLDMSMLPGTPDPVAIERTLWFTDQPPTGFPVADSCFYKEQAGVLGLLPGQFLVVGPRARTNIGSIEETPPTEDDLQLVPSRQRIELNAGVVVFDANGVRLTPNAGNIQPVQTMTASLRSLLPVTRTGAWTNQKRVGLNISEPMPLSGLYYKEPLYEMPGNPGVVDSYRDFGTMNGLVPDVPSDDDVDAPIKQMQETGTYQDIRTAFLQRLADPTLPYHPTLNPYITVDWATIDLTVFNGDDSLTGNVPAGDTYDTQGGRPGDGPDEVFSSRQRGVNAPSLWSPITQFPGVTNNTAATVYFKENIRETLGYVNDPNPRDAVVDHYVAGEAPNNYVGAAKRTTPWITWYNRPFDSPFELLQVPAAPASRLGFEFTVASDVDLPSAADTSGGVNPYTNFYPPYSHLNNFLHTSAVPTTGTPAPAPHFYRLFDYIETPSPFAGTRKYFNPVAGTPATFQSPYGYMSRFRDPGRVNINMVFDQTVFDGILAGAAGNQTQKNALWNQLQLSRQGFGTVVNTPDDAFPTRFANPFRSAKAAGLTPLPGVPGMEHREVDATLLRPNPAAPNVPLFHVASGAAHNNTTNNSHFRYQGLSRLGNLLSTNSNVFGVWITIGYFEVTESRTGVDVAHPDGYELGIELGSDTGEVERHRAFYMIDRSIPVGFEPARNHNVQKAVLLKRYIE